MLYVNDNIVMTKFVLLKDVKVIRGHIRSLMLNSNNSKYFYGNFYSCFLGSFRCQTSTCPNMTLVGQYIAKLEQENRLYTIYISHARA